jgi:hypothetical protein
MIGRLAATPGEGTGRVVVPTVIVSTVTVSTVAAVA